MIAWLIVNLGLLFLGWLEAVVSYRPAKHPLLTRWEVAGWRLWSLFVASLVAWIIFAVVHFVGKYW